MQRHGHRTTMPRLEEFGLTPVTDLAGLRDIRRFITGVRLSEDILDYLVDVIRATREHPSLQFGASPRAANMLASAARALAALSGRDYVIPDDVKYLAPPTLRHRLILAPGAEIDELDVDQVVRQILEQVPSPK